RRVLRRQLVDSNSASPVLSDSSQRRRSYSARRWVGLQGKRGRRSRLDLSHVAGADPVAEHGDVVAAGHGTRVRKGRGPPAGRAAAVEVEGPVRPRAPRRRFRLRRADGPAGAGKLDSRHIRLRRRRPAVPLHQGGERRIERAGRRLHPGGPALQHSLSRSRDGIPVADFYDPAPFDQLPPHPATGLRRPSPQQVPPVVHHLRLRDLRSDGVHPGPTSRQASRVVCRGDAGQIPPRRHAPLTSSSPPPHHTNNNNNNPPPTSARTEKIFQHAPINLRDWAIVILSNCAFLALSICYKMLKRAVLKPLGRPADEDEELEPEEEEEAAYAAGEINRAIG
ncbi:MAG: hypothetical protein BJ554DRAFT_2958, partial [Olpidium bornovanus]